MHACMFSILCGRRLYLSIGSCSCSVAFFLRCTVLFVCFVSRCFCFLSVAHQIVFEYSTVISSVRCLLDCEFCVDYPFSRFVWLLKILIFDLLFKLFVVFPALNTIGNDFHTFQCVHMEKICCSWLGGI